MIVKTKKEAWQKADELFPTDYVKNDAASERAGYPIYVSTLEDSEDRICDLNDRLEVIIGNGHTNIWIDEKPEKVHMSRHLYTGIWMLISCQMSEARNEIEDQLCILDELDHMNPENSKKILYAVDTIKGQRAELNRLTAMMEQFEKEVDV